MNKILLIGGACCVLISSASLTAAQEIDLDEPSEISEIDSDKALAAIQFMNYLRYVSYEISEYQNVFVIEEEYRNLSPDNLNLTRIPDEDILQAIKDHLELLYDIRVDEKTRMRFQEGQRKAAQRHRNDMIVNLLKSGVSASLQEGAAAVTVVSGALSGKVDTEAVKQLCRAVADETFSAYDNYINFQRQLEDESEAFKFEFDDKKAARLHEENLKNFDFTISLLNRYGINDDFRLAESDAKALVQCVKTSDMASAFNRLKVMAKRQPSYEHFPMFWCYYASFAASSKHFDEAIKASLHFDKINRFSLFRHDRLAAQTAMAKIQAMVDSGHLDKKEIADALDVVTHYNFDSHDYDMAFYCATIYYSVLDNRESALETLNALIDVQKQAASGDLVKYRDLFKIAKEDTPYEIPPMVTDLVRCLALRETILGQRTDDEFRQSLEAVFGNTLLQGVESLFLIGEVRNKDLFATAKPELDGISLSYEKSTWRDNKIVSFIPASWFVLGDFPVSIDLMQGSNVVITLDEDFGERRIAFCRPHSDKAFVKVATKCPSKNLKGIDGLVLRMPHKSWPVAIHFEPQAGVHVANADFDDDTSTFVQSSVDFLGKHYTLSNENAAPDTILSALSKKAKNATQGQDNYSIAIAIPTERAELNLNEIAALDLNGRDFNVTWTNASSFVGSLSISATFYNRFGATICSVENDSEMKSSAGGTIALKWPEEWKDCNPPTYVLLTAKRSKSLMEQGKDVKNRLKKLF